jgi:hypothetical protein
VVEADLPHHHLEVPLIHLVARHILQDITVALDHQNQLLPQQGQRQNLPHHQ